MTESTNPEIPLSLDGTAVPEVADAVIPEQSAQHAEPASTQSDIIFAGVTLPDGTGGDYEQVIAQMAKTNANNAQQDGSLTWRHLLEVAFTDVQAADPATDLQAKLQGLLEVGSAWLTAIGGADV